MEDADEAIQTWRKTNRVIDISFFRSSLGLMALHNLLDSKPEVAGVLVSFPKFSL